jgi:hypothetical protein
MTGIDSMLEAANPVPTAGPGSDVSVPPFEDVWAAAQTPVKKRPRLLRPPGGGPVRRARRWFALAGVSTLAAAIVLTAELVLGTSGSGPPSAFAAWSATPTKPTPGEISVAEARCHQPEPAALVDTRGPFELLLFKTRTRQLVECHAWPDGRPDFGEPQPPGKAPSPNALTIIGCNSGGYSTASRHRTQVYLQMYGLIGKNVTQVTLKLTGGATVEATTSNGLWAAWWPGSDRDASVQVKSPIATATTRPTTDSNC